MTTRTWHCPTCGDTWDEQPSTGANDAPGRHWDAHDYNLPLCAGEAIEVYICPVSEATPNWEGDLLMIPNPDPDAR